ncbi:MAG TPA: amino acid adenylation domain-containing protein, partial [Thermoanaerobaculia bacterium]|nr:amino acid adenylation domain-containing protein [Thermoanaerobaculia bacterium]
ILVGTAVAGRNRSDIEGLIGFFVNTLVLRTDLSDDPTFRQLLARVRQAAIGAFEHQDLPFEKLVEALEPKRDLSRTPIFQVFFNVLNFGTGQLRLAELEVDRIEIPLASLFDLTLYVEEARDGIRLSAVFDPELFERAYVSELLEQLVGLLEQVASAPQQRVGSYSLLTASARRLLPDPAVPIPEPEVGIVAEDVLSWSDRAPSAPAVAQQGRVWTYRELAECSRTIAESLLERGLEKGDVVGIEGGRNFGLIASMLGVLRSGGVMLTLDPALPRERRRLMLTEARARSLVLVNAPAQEDPAGDGPDLLPAIRVDENGLCAKAGMLAPDASLPPISPNDPAYVFFTSGTSGAPKAVLGSQKGLSHFLRWQREAFEVGPGDRCAQLTALSFDVLLRDVFLPLTSGATLHLPDAHEEAGSSRTVSWLEREGITILHTVPSVADSWLTASPGGAPLARLRWAFLAGEPLSDALVRRWFSAFPKSGRIVNLYGATEATLAQCFFVVPAEPPPGIQPLGRPLPETQALIMADGERLCGIGELGEIVLRTPFRSLGYLNAPREQQERFVPNPFRIAEGDILYRTGDRGHYGIDGSLEILGRWDDQVKIRGVRVEPAEVASVLSGHASVGSCAVIARADAHGETTLLAYVVSPRPGPETAAELRSHLSARLPAAMLPSAFVFLEQLPRNPSGKLDRRALPLPEPVSEKPDEPLELPRTPVERTVATLWTAVLRRERIGIQEDFFELGGHSLSATQVMSRVNQAFRLDMPVRALFENPTIASLSSAIESSLLDEWQRAARGGARAHAIEAPPSRAKERLDESGDGEPAPDATAGTSRPHSRPATSLSFAQERLWMLDRVNPGLSFYNIASAFRLIGSLDVEALERALGSIEERHEVLRACFVTEGGRPVQVIGPVRAPALSVVDLSALEEGERETEARRMADEEARRPFDLSRGPLVRAKLLRLSG